MLPIRVGDEIEYRWMEHQKTYTKSGKVVNVLPKYLVVFTGMYRDTVMTNDIERGKVWVSILNGEGIAEICETSTSTVFPS